MRIRIICIGKLKEKYWQEAISEYSKRLKSYCTLEIVELKEARLPANAGPAEEEQVKQEEGRAILEKVRPEEYAIALEIKGKRLTSEGLADLIANKALSGEHDIDFIIGGSLGLSDDVRKRANMQLSFSDMTFPHQMMRVILLEQIYRAFKIMRNEPYHK